MMRLSLLSEALEAPKDDDDFGHIPSLFSIVHPMIYGIVDYLNALDMPFENANISLDLMHRIIKDSDPRRVNLNDFIEYGDELTFDIRKESNKIVPVYKIIARKDDDIVIFNIYRIRVSDDLTLDREPFSSVRWEWSEEQPTLHEALEAPKDDDDFGSKPSFCGVASDIVHTLIHWLNNREIKLRDIYTDIDGVVSTLRLTYHEEYYEGLNFRITKREPRYSSAPGFFLYINRGTNTILFDVNYGRDLPNEWYATRLVR